MVARILRMREQSPIISNYFSSGARIKPAGAQACPPLVTPLTFGVGIRVQKRFSSDLESKAKSTKNNFRV